MIEFRGVSFGYGDVPVFVFTKRKFTSDRDSVRFLSGELEDLVANRLKSQFKNIWMVGGAELTKEFLRKDLADEIVISILPVLLGGGTLFFDFIGVEKRLHLKDVVAYKDGMVEMTYSINKD